MDFSNITSLIRKTTKKYYWQALYSSAKELRLNLFENRIDYSDLQILFLNYLAFYYNLNLDIMMNDVSEDVTDSEIYEDAYSYFKRKDRLKKQLDAAKASTQINLNRFNQSKQEKIPIRQDKWVFKRSPHK